MATEISPTPSPSKFPGPSEMTPHERNHLTFRKISNAIWMTLCVAAACIAVVALAWVLIYLLVSGFRSMNLAIFTQGPTPEGVKGGGLRNAILGTLVLIGVASSIGLPLGILGGVYQLEAKGWFVNTVRFLTDVLNSIPSIVIGLFVYALIVIPVAKAHPGHGYSALAGGIALGFLMIPTVMRTTEEILRLVPNTMREGSLALGAARWRTMFSIILPAARGGIITGVMLALSRIAGETAPLLFTAFGNSAFNVSLSRPIESLPHTIYIYSTAPDDYLNAQAEAGAIILILLIFVMSIAARLSTRGGMLTEK